MIFMCTFSVSAQVYTVYSQMTILTLSIFLNKYLKLQFLVHFDGFKFGMHFFQYIISNFDTLDQFLQTPRKIYDRKHGFSVIFLIQTTSADK